MKSTSYGEQKHRRQERGGSKITWRKKKQATGTTKATSEGGARLSVRFTRFLLFSEDKGR